MKEVFKDKIFLIVILFVLISGIIFLFPMFNLKKTILKEKEEPSINIPEIISRIKEENLNNPLVYEDQNLKEIISLVYQENNYYKSIIIDKTTGELKEFLDLIKNKEAFNTKLTELLSLKYPAFIVEELQNQAQYYYVKNNEVIVYFNKDNLSFTYSKDLFVKINYQEIKNNLKFTPFLDSEYQNEDGYVYNGTKKLVALTFDDGPSSTYNPKILESLAQNKAHATFFMVGNMMNSCHSCVINTFKSGNEIGSHTYEHLNLKTNSIAKVNDSLKKTNDIYYNLTGNNIKLVRPPYGSYDKENLQNISSPLILWNLDTEDWRYRNVDHITNYIKQNVTDGSIILMHELYETSYEAATEILKWLYLNDYQVVSVSKLASLKGKTLEIGKAYSSLK